MTFAQINLIPRLIFLGTQAAVAAGCVTTQIPDLRPATPLLELGQHIAQDLSAAMHQLDIQL